MGGLIVGLVRRFRRAGRAVAAVHETDKDGKFRAEAKNTNCWIVVTHPSGYAELPGMPNSNPRIIKLKPWARIEGRIESRDSHGQRRRCRRSGSSISLAKIARKSW